MPKRKGATVQHAIAKLHTNDLLSFVAAIGGYKQDEYTIEEIAHTDAGVRGILLALFGVAADVSLS